MAHSGVFYIFERWWGPGISYLLPHPLDGPAQG